MEDIGNSISVLVFVGLIIALCVFIAWFFIFKVKHLKTPNLYMVDGGVKVGKTEVCVMLSIKQYRKNIIKAKITNAIIRVLNKFRKNKIKYREIPMLYSNMPLYKVKYNALTMDILLWKVRIPHKSVVLIDEATLLADSMLGMQNKKDRDKKKEEVDEILTLFLKTYGHQTHGGSCFYNSQQVIDLHFAFKRNTSCYLFIAKRRKYPFFSLLDVRELIHDESGDVVNTNTRDLDDDNKPLFVSNRWYKYYDQFYLDVLTKHLETYVDYDVEKVEKKNKKDIKEILTLGNYKRIREYNESQQKKEVSKDA